MYWHIAAWLYDEEKKIFLSLDLDSVHSATIVSLSPLLFCYLCVCVILFTILEIDMQAVKWEWVILHRSGDKKRHGEGTGETRERVEDKNSARLWGPL